MHTLDCSPYCESFLEYRDSNGQTPLYALRQIFRDHLCGRDTVDEMIEEFQSETDQSLWRDGVTILQWLGY